MLQSLRVQRYFLPGYQFSSNFRPLETITSNFRVILIRPLYQLDTIQRTTTNAISVNFLRETVAQSELVPEAHYSGVARVMGCYLPGDLKWLRFSETPCISRPTQSTTVYIIALAQPNSSQINELSLKVSKVLLGHELFYNFTSDI